MCTDIRFTLGAVLGGALASTALSGALCLQTFLYFNKYTNDPKHLKALVSLVWTMDTIQTCCIISLSYQYIILNFGWPEIDDHRFGTVTVRHLAVKTHRRPSSFNSIGFYSTYSPFKLLR
ncbi:hypothetical protein F5148DRAFT_1167212 [Russula earlei]|uniref:Uncharacterized protein n=1 Tax=Russula earlei TaxID=71964 RepID=A0ACC0UJL3_9AGAM|nr:hypothetical protein F5148DRAFT_1167212 [Russula earlei]